MSGRLNRVFFRAGLFSLASNAAVLFVLKFGLFLWPDRLPANSQNLFWLASGVNVAGLILLGLGYWPVLLLNAFPAAFLVGEPLDLTLLGSATNALEALLAAWLIMRAGRYAGQFDSLRSVGALLVASFVAPLVNTLIIPAYFCARGILPWANYPSALANWNLSNGAAMLVLAPLILALAGRRRNVAPREREFLLLTGVAVGVCVLAFDSVFEGAALNFAFLVFPVVIYAAVRFGSPETSAVLALALASIYGSIAVHAHAQPPAQMAETIWFVQAFTWVLSTTGLLVAALVAERRRAETQSLEATLREERARLAALRYQINPHFLFNALNSIRAALPLKDAVPRDMITELADYLRFNLAHYETDVVSLREELQATSGYLAVERHRFGDELRVTTEIAPEAESVPIPILILQPLVENAIRHGFESSHEPFHLKITASVDDARLVVEVANTGTWKTPGEGTGLGLENVRCRLASHYREDFLMGHSSGDDWVRMRISVPLRVPQS